MNYRKLIIRFFTFLGGIYFFLKFVLPERIGGVPVGDGTGAVSGGFEFGRYHQEISDSLIVIASMAIGLGLINILMVHGSKVALRKKGWIASLTLLLGLLLMLFYSGKDWLAGERTASEIQKVISLRDFSDLIKEDYEAQKAGIMPWYERNSRLKHAVSETLFKIESAERYDKNGELSAKIVEVRAAADRLKVDAKDSPNGFEENRALSAAIMAMVQPYREWKTDQYSETTERRVYSFLNEGLFTSLGAAMFSLLGFYIAAAAYRAFRIKSPESALMMAAAVLVMLGQIPFGVWLWDGFPAVRLWLLQVPNAAASRAIEIGAAVAGLVMAFRMWLSIESEKFD